MSLQYVGGKTVNNNSGAIGSVSLTDLTGGIASAPIAGDIVIAVAQNNKQLNAADYPVIDTSGYTLISNIFADDSSEVQLTAKYKIMGGSPDTSIAFSNMTTDRGAVVAIHVWRGIDSATPMDVSPVPAQAIDSGIPDPASITPITAGAIVLAIGAKGYGNNAHEINAAPSGYTNLKALDGIGSATTVRASVGIASKAWTSGAENPGAFGVGGTSTSSAWGAVTLALRPATPPTVTTGAATDVESDIATANGNITATGTPPVTRRGFVYDTSSHGDPGTTTPEASDYDFIEDESGSFSTGAFSLGLTGLSQGTQYYVRAFAYNGFEYDYGSEQTFTTEIIPVLTISSSNITQTEAQLNGEIIAGTIVRRGFVYGKSSQSNPGNVAPGSSGYDDTIDETGSFGNGAYDLLAEDLDYDDTYYFRAFVEDNLGDYYYGTQFSFSTPPLDAPAITSVDPAGTVLGVATPITIIGENFYEGVTVEIDGEACTDIVLVDAQTITAVCPVSGVQKSAILIVENTDAQQASISFFYMQEVPTPPAETPVTAKFSVEAVGYTN